ncbi:hypothetical protein [Prosthecobacter sp.]|uniref:hypothetical protein n=1 Tax=Prosthecobacter sp. TaxID=1965333 RepID=UPI00248A8114|nr:hypothetical protein [Prosthecobacter sp.]MDI1315067.1 hypothetical protein [Prosthecobacter sp.]
MKQRYPIIILLWITLTAVFGKAADALAPPISVLKMIAPASVFGKDCEVDETEVDEVVLELMDGEIPPELKQPVSMPTMVVVPYSEPDIEISLIYHNSVEDAEQGFAAAHQLDKGGGLLNVSEIKNEFGVPLYKADALRRSFLIVANKHNIRVIVRDVFGLLDGAKRTEIMKQQLGYLDSVAEGSKKEQALNLPTEMRSWTSKDGKVMTGRVISADKSSKTVVFERNDGVKFPGFNPQNLSAADQEFLRSYLGAP